MASQLKPMILFLNLSRFNITAHFFLLHNYSVTMYFNMTQISSRKGSMGFKQRLNFAMRQSKKCKAVGKFLELV
jgi:predicted LPLAT superfamily acyltransferase